MARGRTDAVTRTDATEIISSGKLWVGVRGEGDYTATGSYETGMIYACTGSQWAFVPGGGGKHRQPRRRRGPEAGRTERFTLRLLSGRRHS
ncbi:MAG: hypothetical protein LUE99_15000 [Bacteroides sp.]|nr:hypothetical protein [Bacteroides sp.]